MNREDARVFVIAGMLAAIILFGAAFLHAAHAADAPVKPSTAICWAVRKAIQNYGESALIDWARARGISEAEINSARRCLK